jgi:hypothetical protein
MKVSKLEKAIESIERDIPPWGEELGKLMSLDRLLFERCSIKAGGLIGVPSLELSAIESVLYLHRLNTLCWAVVLFWKPKNFCFPTPRGHREDYKPLGAVYAAVMDLTEKLHSLDKNRTYTSAAEWFRLVTEEQEIEGISTGLGKSEDLKLLQSQNAQLSGQENPFSKPHTCHLIQLAIEHQTLGRISESYRALVATRKRWATAFKAKSWKSLIDYQDTIATAPNDRQSPTSTNPLFIDGVKTLREPILDV